MSNEEIKEKIELLKEFLEYGMEYKDYIPVEDAFEDIKKLIEKKDKMIDLMAETMALDIMYADEDKDVQTMKEKIKERYRKKVEND